MGERCVDVDNKKRLMLQDCPKGRNDGPWDLQPDHLFKHKENGLCAEANDKDELWLKKCDTAKKQQLWESKEIHPK